MNSADSSTMLRVAREILLHVGTPANKKPPLKMIDSKEVGFLEDGFLERICMRQLHRYDLGHTYLKILVNDEQLVLARLSGRPLDCSSLGIVLHRADTLRFELLKARESHLLYEELRIQISYTDEESIECLYSIDLRTR